MKAIQEDEQLLIFRVGTVMCCVSARDVDSVITAQPLTKIPHQSSSACGVMQYRNDTVSVINLFQKFEFPTPQSQEHGVFIMAYTRHGIVGYWVDQVIDITSNYGAHWASPPLFMDGNIFDKTLIWKEHLVLLTDFERLFAMYDAGSLQQWAEKHSTIKPLDEDQVLSDIEKHQDVQNHNLIEEAGNVFPESKAEEDISLSAMTDVYDEDEISLSAMTDVYEGEDISLSAMTDMSIEEDISISAMTEVSGIDEPTVITKIEDTDTLDVPSTLGALDSLSDTTQFDESELEPDQNQKNSNSMIHLTSNFVIEGNDEIDSGPTNLYKKPAENSDISLEKVEKSSVVVGKVSKKKDKSLQKTVEDKPAIVPDKKPKVIAAVTDIKSAPARNRDFLKESVRPVSAKEYAANATQAIVYDYIKLNMQPTTAQLNWSNDPYAVQQRHQQQAIDIEKLFEEKISPKVKEYFESVEASRKKLKQKDTLISENEKNTEKSYLQPLEPLSDIDSEHEETTRQDKVVPLRPDSVITSAVSTFEDNHEPLELRRKKEESIVKVIKRINQNKPEKQGFDKLRMTASVLLVATVIFLLQHFHLLPGSGPIENFSEIKLLNENVIDSHIPLENQFEEIPPLETQHVDENSQPSRLNEEQSPISSIEIHETIKTIQTISPAESVLQPQPEASEQLNEQVQPQPPLAEAHWNNHIVVRGDTLWAIAGTYLNDPFRYPDLARWNKIKNPDLIYPGDEVKYTRDQQKK